MQWLRRHRRSILFACAVLAFGGLYGAFSMPVSLFPDAAFPRVQVFLDAGDRSAEQMTLELTRPVEEAIRDVRGVTDVRSVTSRGSAEISVNFAWGTDMRRALLEVDAAVSQVLPELPPETRVRARLANPTVFPILAYSLRSKSVALTRLRDLAEYQLRPLLTGIPGVARVQVQGGEIAEYHVDVDLEKLRADGLSMADVVRAVNQAATLQALGRLEDHYKLYLILADNQPDDVAALERIVVRAGPGGVVTVGDVARVTRSAMPQWVRVNADGQDAVLLSIYQQPDANSVELARAVKARLAGYAPHMPKDVQVANWYDQTQLVIGAAGAVRDAIVVGVLLAGLVLFGFLRNARVILIALLEVPAVVAVTVLLLHVTGQSFNMMTLGGMAAAVGLIIDDVIVMLEHLMRRLREGAGPIPQRVPAAAWEFSRPLAGSSAATIVIFVPLAFLTGVAGAFFKALALTMAAGLLISFALTWAVVPILAEWLLDERHAQEPSPTRVGAWLRRRYEGELDKLLRRPWLLLAGVLPLLALGGFAYTRVGSGFMPQMDEGGFILDYRAAPGTSLSETNRLLNQVEALIRADPDVATYSRRTGTQLGGGITEANEGDFFIRLKSGPRQPIEQVMARLRHEVETQVPGLQIELAQLMEDLIGDLVAVPQPIEIKLFADDAPLLETTARKVAATIGRVRGVVDVKDGILPAGDALEVRVDPVRAGLEGMDPGSVTQQVDAAVAGQVAAQLVEPPKRVGVRVWLAPDARARVEQLESLPITAPDGHVFPLSRVAALSAVSGQPQIVRENLKRMIAVTARIEGRSLGGTVAEVQATLAAAKVIPDSVYVQYGGLYAQQRQAFRDLLLVMGAAVALVFALLLFLYERLSVALAIIAAPLSAMSAVFIGLWLTGIELNIGSMMGMTMIVGIVTEIAIFYFSEFESLPEDRPLRERLLATGHHRLRPILMSALAAILTLLPLALAPALGLGAGAQLQQPLAVAIVSGLIVAVPLVLVAMPAGFALLVREANSR